MIGVYYCKFCEAAFITKTAKEAHQWTCQPWTLDDEQGSEQ